MRDKASLLGHLHRPYAPYLYNRVPSMPLASTAVCPYAPCASTAVCPLCPYASPVHVCTGPRLQPVCESMSESIRMHQSMSY
jgi:hypothetical protein